MYRRFVVLAIAIAINGCNGLSMPAFDLEIKHDANDEACQCDECILFPLKEEEQ